MVSLAAIAGLYLGVYVYFFATKPEWRYRTAATSVDFADFGGYSISEYGVWGLAGPRPKWNPTVRRAVDLIYRPVAYLHVKVSGRCLRFNPPLIEINF